MRKREAEAAAKTNRENKKLRKSKAEVAEINNCFVCKNNFHHHCLPKIHNNLIPDVDDNLFICHTCYKEESEEETDENIESEEEDDDVNQARKDEAKRCENGKNNIETEDESIIEKNEEKQDHK